MQYRAFDPDIEVNGQTVLAVVAGMGAATWLAEKMLRDEGIDDPRPGEWYSQQAWLNAFKAVADKVGVLTLHKIGTSIPDNADWPPEIEDIHGALASIDVAYHLNHRKHGTILMDMGTKTMREGIGHYAYTRTDDGSGTMVCENPYPCDFDMGIVEATARKFHTPGAPINVAHEGGSCRKKGDEACTYLVSW